MFSVHNFKLNTEKNCMGAGWGCRQRLPHAVNVAEKLPRMGFLSVCTRNKPFSSFLLSSFTGKKLGNTGILRTFARLSA